MYTQAFDYDLPIDALDQAWSIFGIESLKSSAFSILFLTNEEKNPPTSRV